MSDTRKKILAVDDEQDILEIVADFLSKDFQVLTMPSAIEALKIIEEWSPDLILTDVNMPGMTGIEFLKEVRARNINIPTIVFTGYSDKDMAIDALRFQASDFLEKPIVFSSLKDSVLRALAHSGRQLQINQIHENLERAKMEIELQAVALEELYSSGEMISVNRELIPAAFHSFLSANGQIHSRLLYCAAIAKTKLPILITGETGVGKDVVAHSIHNAAERSGKFIAANIAGMDDALLADTLFGHVSGAFTSADKARPGLIEAAAGGTLFLDEIGDLSSQSQVKLLRLLESGEYYQLGSDQIKKSDARIITATHRNLDLMASKDEFRKDLIYRLRTHQVHISPLRERREDIPVQLEHFINAAALELKVETPRMPKELLILLSNYDFPGNTRELKSMVLDAVSRQKGGNLALQPFVEKMQRSDGHTPPATTAAVIGFMQTKDPGRMPTLKEAEESLIEEALRRADGNQAIAARMLGITRQALNKRLIRSQDKKTA